MRSPFPFSIEVVDRKSDAFHECGGVDETQSGIRGCLILDSEWTRSSVAPREYWSLMLDAVCAHSSTLTPVPYSNSMGTLLNRVLRHREQHKMECACAVEPPENEYLHWKHVNVVRPAQPITSIISIPHHAFQGVNKN